MRKTDTLYLRRLHPARPTTHNPSMDAADTLLVIDVQRAFVSGPQAVPGCERLLAAVALLLENARAAQARVIFLQNDSAAGAVDEPHGPGWQLHFAPRAGEAIVRKTQDDGFAGTDLDTLLKAGGTRAIAACGLLSEMCVAATVRAALARGYAVILPHDAHATGDVPAGPGS
ncbi:MAG: isochorismatase family protein, partial [Myxococcota bacterium]